jgi:hypothetical protein
MKKCRKCEKIIPNWITIDGKRKNLQNRKFCIVCSPYKGHNTSPHDPVLRKKSRYQDYTEEQKKQKKEQVAVYLYHKALLRRDDLINRSGGKCLKCGYGQCKRSLCFHHRDPELKSFGLTLNQLWTKSQSEIDNEWNKCDMLCANCHMELEDKIAQNHNGIISKVNIKYGTNF